MAGKHFPRRLISLAVALVAMLSGGVVATPAYADASDDLDAAVLDSLGRSTASGIAAQVYVDGVGLVTDLRPDLALQPASTQKLYTTGAALLELGAGHRVRTDVRPNGPRLGSILFGDLVYRSEGDPTLGEANIRGFAGAVAGSGIRRVYGDIWMDDTLFDRVRSAPGLKPGWMPRYVGPLSAIALDSNAYRADTAFLADPARAAGERFRTALAAAGVSVRGEIRIGQPPVPVRAPLAEHETPLPAIVRRILKGSDNFAAEQLLKLLGSRIGSGTNGGGIEFVNLVATKAGLARSGAADGSGLSTHNWSTAKHQAEWLMGLAASPVGEMYRSSLPIACVDGTLYRRMCGTGAAGKVFAKTGYVAGVVTLSGYTTTATGKRVTFSFLLNGVSDVDAARGSIDRAVVLLATANL